jgi:hypothetical protein
LEQTELLRRVLAILEELQITYLVDRDYVARWAEEFGVTEIWHAILRRVGEKPA